MNIYKYFGNAFLANAGVLGRKTAGTQQLFLGKCFTSFIDTFFRVIFQDTRTKIQYKK